MKVLSSIRARFGDDDPRTLVAMNNLAYLYGAAGQPERSTPLLEQVVRRQRAKLGGDHPQTLIKMNNLAAAYRETGHLDRAIPLLEQALRASRPKLGEDHPQTLLVMHSLAVAYRDDGQLDRAIPMLEQTLKAEQAKLGENHLQTLYTQRSLALAYQDVRRYQDAEALFRDAVGVVGRTNPRNDRLYCVALALFGRCLILEQKYPEAVSVLREHLEIKEKALPDDWTTAEARSLLGEALAAQRSFPEAERFLLAGEQGLVERREKIPARQRDATMHDAVARLVRLYEAWNKPTEAQKWKQQLSPAPAGRRSQRGTDGIRQL